MTPLTARIYTTAYDRLVLEFSETPEKEDSWSFRITFTTPMIHEEMHFMAIDGDIEYEDEEIEPPWTVEEMVCDVISRRWPIPWSKEDMISAAKTAWKHHVITAFT